MLSISFVNLKKQEIMNSIRVSLEKSGGLKKKMNNYEYL